MCLDCPSIFLNRPLRRLCWIFNFISEFIDFLVFCRIWHLGGFGRMENLPTGCADDLYTILGHFRIVPNSRSVNILFGGWILHQAVLKKIFASQSSAQPCICWRRGLRPPPRSPLLEFMRVFAPQATLQIPRMPKSLNFS